MASANVHEFTDANFSAEAIKSPVPVLVDFWAEWCGPCRAIAPMIEEIAKEYEGKIKVGKVNVDHNEQLATDYRIQSIPTLMVLAGGQVKETIVGLRPKADLVAIIARHIRAG